LSLPLPLSFPFSPFLFMASLIVSPAAEEEEEEEA
jgi:hypothetical protein